MASSRRSRRAKSASHRRRRDLRRSRANEESGKFPGRCATPGRCNSSVIVRPARRERFDLTLDPGDERGSHPFRGWSAEAHHVASEWTPGDSVLDRHDQRRPLAVQVRPILNGYHLAHRGMSLEARVYTRREAELAALMPDKKVGASTKALLCPMPGLVKAISVKQGQE